MSSRKVHTQDLPYPSGLYRIRGLAEGVTGFGSVSESEVARFHDQGFLVVNDAIAPEEVEAALQALVGLIDGKVPDYKGIQFEPSVNDVEPDWMGEEKQDRVRKFWKFVDFEPRLKRLSEHVGLIDTVGRLMGDVPELYQDMALVKPPKIGSEKPWHQDHAYFNVPLGTCIVGAWIALDEATIENGCMQVVPGSHRNGPVVHFQRRDWQICDTDANRNGSLAVPLRPGGCLFFHSLLHHGTPANRSALRRRAVQFHYKPRRAVPTSDVERMSLFGSEGKDVEC